MKYILVFAATTLLVSTVNASDSYLATSTQHAAHHADAQQVQQHQKVHQDETVAAHVHDHQGNVKQANQHAKEHANSHAIAHDHDHNNDSASATAHSHDHGIS